MLLNHFYTKVIFIFFLIYTIDYTNSNAQNNNFIKVKDGNFNHNGKKYKYIGTNYWYGSIIGQTEQGKKRLINELDFLVAHKIENLRILIGAEGEGLIGGIQRVGPALQREKGIYNEDCLKGLDFLLAEMQKRNLKAVLFLSNNWEWSGGFLQYLNWNGLMPDSILQRRLTWDENRDYVSKFYTCANCKQDYINQLKYILNHTNTITKQKYIDDPTIMSWELANEPRPMRQAATTAYLQWITETSTLIKTMDKNHLVTTGVEGYIGTDGIYNFEKIHQFKSIDYATIHIWPKNWAWYKDSSFVNDFETVLKKTNNYIKEHSIVMKQLKKPLVIEEFGLPRDGFSFSPTSTVNYRDKYFENIFKQLVFTNKASNKIDGINFWAFGGYGKAANNIDYKWKKGDDFTGDPPMEEQGLNTVFAKDSTTWQLVIKYTKLL